MILPQLLGSGCRIWQSVSTWSASKERGINPPLSDICSDESKLALSKSYKRSCGVNYDASLGAEGRALVVIYYHKLGHKLLPVL